MMEMVVLAVVRCGNDDDYDDGDVMVVAVVLVMMMMAAVSYTHLTLPTSDLV